ncbi:Zn-dependent exopeptidase [Panus rudis PR-1116 ss-1]|nr:Zn-dependent exopeptidase [Panus rudis PR-1116 ss-1]
MEHLTDIKGVGGQSLPQPVPNSDTPARRKQSSRKVVAFALLFIALSGAWELFKHAVDEYTQYQNLNSASSWAIDAMKTRALLKNANDAEKLFLSVPSAKSALATSRQFATYPHLAASKEDFEDAKDILKIFQEQFNITPPSTAPVFPAGSPESRSHTLDINKLSFPSAWIDVYYPVMNTGVNASLQILDADDDEKAVWTADLIEDGDPRDPEASKYRDAIPPWHGLSAEGDVQGQLIYVNYGTKEDFDTLVEAGVDFKGKIVLARYFAVFRGLKIKAAQEVGAAGVLIYSDPRDDGSVTVENGYAPYPEGPARNPVSIQRGSVQFISSYPGDPTTPGYPAYENATRTDGENIPKIPSLPISWANAQKLLAEISEDEDARVLNGKVSKRKVRLVNKVNNRVMPIWNTMAVIPGHIKNESVLVGCHRDAWVMGAADPTSGTVSLLEVVRGLGALLKSGWRPLRNIVIASWDAEEYGLVGSTEWGEDFADWLAEHVVAYLNVDVSVAGSAWMTGGSPSLAHLIRKTAQDLPHPLDANRTLWDARTDVGPYKGPADAEYMRSYDALQAQKAASTGIPPLGSGSDYTVFLQRIGIASMDQGFGPTPSDAVYHYHSIYDSQRWQEVYADPTFEKHVSVAKHIGLMTLRLADSIILPLNTTQYALELGDYLDRVEAIAPSSFSKLRTSIRKLQSASRKLDNEKEKAEKKFRKLLDKISRWDTKSQRVLRWLKVIVGLGSQDEGKVPVKKLIKAAKRVQAANAKLAAFERGFISEEGIKDREWYRHLGVAPGKWLGYGATTLPALTEAIVYEKNTTLAAYEADRLTSLLDNLTIFLTA